MSLSSAYLDAFLEVSKSKSFSIASRELGITQSAISQRIANLEIELESTLVVRNSSPLYLTPAGETLLRYCKIRQALEEETVGALKSSTGKKSSRENKTPSLTGVIRIGAYSSISRSLVLPRIAKLLRAHPDLKLELRSAELADLPKLLKSGELDYVITDRHLGWPGVVDVMVGTEENVLVCLNSKSIRIPDLFFDHDTNDVTTEMFFAHQPEAKRPKQLLRMFLDDIYTILDAVRLGLGMAVVSRHLVEGDSKLSIVPGLKPLRSDIVLHYYRQPYYTDLHAAVINALETLRLP